MVLRIGFTGELSFELHHPRSRGAELWDALLRTGSDRGIVPHGLDALKLLRLEKGHILVGQDTDFDTTPRKLGLDALVSSDKPYFVGQAALTRLGALPLKRRLASITFTGKRHRTKAPSYSRDREGRLSDLLPLLAGSRTSRRVRVAQYHKWGIPCGSRRGQSWPAPDRGNCRRRGVL